VTAEAQTLPEPANGLSAARSCAIPGPNVFDAPEIGAHFRCLEASMRCGKSDLNRILDSIGLPSYDDDRPIGI
jgi:hypothetical protein